MIEEQFSPDRTFLTLEFKKSDRKKATEKSDRKEVTKRTQMQIDTVLEYMEEGKWYKAGEFVDVLGVKETRTKEVLRLMLQIGMLETVMKTIRVVAAIICDNMENPSKIFAAAK